MKHEFLYGACELYEVDKAERSAVFEITNDNVNRGGVVNRTKGIDFTDFRSNNTVLFGHMPELYVGVAPWPVKVKGMDEENKFKMLSKVMFGKSDFSEKILQDVQDENSGLKHSSIGIDPVEQFFMQEAENKYKEDFGKKPKAGQLWKYNRSSKLVEWSIVPIAMNADAMKQDYAINMGYMKELYSALEPTQKNALALNMLETYMEKIESMEKQFQKLADSLGKVDQSGGDGAIPLAAEKSKAGELSTKGWTISAEQLNALSQHVSQIFKG